MTGDEHGEISAAPAPAEPAGGTGPAGLAVGAGESAGTGGLAEAPGADGVGEVVGAPGTAGASGGPGASGVLPPAVDPMKGFRGVMAGTLVLEAIVVALALLVVARQEGGLASWVGAVVGASVVVLVVTCGLLRRDWSRAVVAVVQLALIACVVSAPAVGVVGLLFAGVWGYLLWLRRDVAQRMAAGRLPGQQPTGHSG